jgi:hypothetical protein
MALYELKLKKEVNILKSRVKLNELVSKYIDQDQNHGVLAIFEKGTDDFRFTFTARNTEYDEEQGDFKNTKTDNKRFTYVLGKNESCKTPAQRFFDLSTNKNKAEIKDIEDAFSVEKLSKLFFKEYKDQYNAFVNYMMQTPSIFTAIYSNDDKAIRDFVKILLGRIIFIKFVQKKGWMGVEANSTEWIAGDYRFLENGFTHFKHKDLFYSTFLEPLFDALDEPNRPNDIFNVTNSRVPYLSGGLFELEDKKTKNINFPAKYFNDLFEFLDRYNFTIDENDTNDHEVGIDPEMLGHIFENLLEDNKDKGAFYTPKEIVRYMCQESLKEYLKTSLENNNQWPSDATEAATFEQNLHHFVTKKEAGGIIEFEETIARALKEVKICDPAIGSGAFPMGLLNEIFQLVHKLHDANKDKVERVWELQGWQPNLVKQNIIQNSIYGVDIEKGAVDVARLRFWLSLIVDEPEPKALPHLDYKIVVGNSLLSKLDVDNNEKQKNLLKEISNKQKAVFDPNSDDEKLSLEIRNLKIDLLCEQLKLMIGRQNIQKEPKIVDYKNKTKAKFAQDQAKHLETIGWQQQITKLQKLKKNHEAHLHFFDWKLDFPEIMNNQVTDKVGFDIVIGNPPYVSAPTMVKSNPQLRDGIINTKRYSSLYQKWDLYIPFMELGLQLLANQGIFSMIVPYPLTNQNYGMKLRELIINKYNLKEIVDLNGTKIFENATVSNCIPFISKSIPNDACFVSNLNKHGKIERVFNQKFTDLVQDEKTLVWNLTSEKRETSRYANMNVLGDYCYISKGMVLNADENTAKGEFTKDDLISESYDEIHCRKYIEAKDIQRYNVKRIRYLEYNTIRCPEKLSRPTFREFYEQPKLMFNRLGNLMVYLDTETKFLHSDSMYSAVLWKDFEGVDNKSISASVKRYSNLQRNEMAALSKAIDLQYLLGILNSKYASVLLTHLRAGDYHIYPEHIRNIPIPHIINNKQQPFITKVKRILELKSEGKETIYLEQEIDNLVYKLYELTYDEILVVEPEFSERMSMVEYKDLNIE